MAETKFPNPNDHLAANYCETTHQASGSRGWRCPSDIVIATYLDGSLSTDHRKRVQSHLTRCEFCRSLVGQIARAQTREAPPLPAGLLQRAIAANNSKSKLLSWKLLPIAASLVIVFTVFATFMIWTGGRVAIPASPMQIAPEIAKASPEPTLSRAIPDKVRKPVFIERSPNVILPRLNSIVAPGEVEFRWKPVPQSRYYQLRLTRSDGDLVWETQSELTGLRLPASIDLTNGTYFVWILAQLNDGQVRKSPAVRFRVVSLR
jgi:hypothetical protein